MAAFKTLEIIRLGFRSLTQHALRSLLTMLGILCGVAAVIAMLAIGEGTSQETQEQFRRLGANNIILQSVKPGDKPAARVFGMPVLAYGLTYADLQRMKDILLHAEVVVPQRRIPREVRYSHRKMRATIVGTVPWDGALSSAALREGRRLIAADEYQNLNHCVLGYKVAEALFQHESPLGKALHVAGDYYRIVGVLAPRGMGGRNPMGGDAEDLDTQVYIPLATARTRFGQVLIATDPNDQASESVELHEIHVRVPTVDQVMGTSRAIEELFGRTHRYSDWSMFVPLQQIEEAKAAGERFSIMLAAIAAISLLVGGIGIMNIMLASVTERTREIGIRRALGAKKRDIVLQFLVETVVISFMGGLLGVGGGIFIPWAITKFMEQKTVVTPQSLVLSVAISLGIGLIFGMYPAWRAAQLDPIEALRHE